MNKLLVAALLFTASLSHAELSSLNLQEMQETSGQGGADLSLTMSLNHRYANDMSLTDISKRDTAGKVIEAYYGYSCVQDVQCRFAFSPNNHKDGNNQKWLVFKQIQGTVQVDKFSLAGTTIINKDGNPQTAMKLSFYDDKPLKIRNLGFSNLSVETDDAATKGYAKDSKYSQYNGYVYDDAGVKTTQKLNVPTFDNGSETGFMGLNVHGNLHMTGDIKIFSYNCSGASSARC
ncbi:MAG: hypothetical protein ACN6NX_12935 [Acinetobacter sp.]